MAGVRTLLGSMVVVLVDVDDTLASIFSSDMAGNYVAQRAGIGINGRIRGINSRIRGGEVTHRSYSFTQKV